MGGMGVNASRRGVTAKLPARTFTKVTDEELAEIIQWLVDHGFDVCRVDKGERTTILLDMGTTTART
jgi:hypothetical protein